MDSSFKNSLENKLWPEEVREASWSDIKRRAAQDPSWTWHHPRALDDLKEDLLKRDQWRDLGNGFIQRGPFPKPPATVSIQILSRDPETGKVRLRVVPRQADRVRLAEDGAATPYSELLSGWEVETDQLRLSFLPEDSTGEHETGEPITWTNTIDVKYRLFQDGSERRCELKAIPCGQIRYTTDGANPSVSGAVYAEPFTVPAGTRYVLALASADGVTSGVERFDVPIGPIIGPVVDREKPATWRRTFKLDSTGETFSFLEQLAKHHAWPGGIRLQGLRDPHWWELTTDEGSFKEPERLRALADSMMELFPGRNIALDVETLQFSRGQELLDLVAELKTELKVGEVRQEG